MFFFYNRDTGAARAGKLDASGNYTDLNEFPARTFGDWTHIVGPAWVDSVPVAGGGFDPIPGGLFFYNRRTGAAASGKLDSTGQYTNLKGFPDGQFGDWTHILSMVGVDPGGAGGLFFYNKQTGAAALGKLDTDGNYISVKDFPAGTFGSWTHIVFAGGIFDVAELFFYNRQTRAGAVGGTALETGEYTSVKDFPAGTFGAWSHIVPGAVLFFYRRGTGAAGSGTFDDSGNFTDLKDYPSGIFGEFSHILPELFLCNSDTGAAASGKLQDDGNYVDLREFPSGTFEGWTHIAGTSN